MLTQFRQCYPQGSLISELLTIDAGQYVVRVSVQNQGLTLGTGLAAARMLEEAEDKARKRALETLDLTFPLSQPTSLPTTVEPDAPSLPELLPTSGPEKKKKSTKSSHSSQKEDLEIVQLSEETLEIVQLSEETAVDSPPSPEVEAETAQEEVKPSETETKTASEKNGLAAKNLEITLEKPLSFEETAEPEIEVETSETAEAVTPPLDFSQPMDFSDVIAETNVELKRLGWTQEQGRNYLIQTYGKRSRQLLSDEELVEFLQYLKRLES